MREKNWDRERERYKWCIGQYRQAVADNADAANRAYVGQQEKLNNIYRTASFQQQAQLTQLTKGTGQYGCYG